MPLSTTPETTPAPTGNPEVTELLTRFDQVLAQANGNADSLRLEIGKKIFPHLFATSEPPKFESRPVGGGNDFEDQMSRPGKGGGQIWDNDVSDRYIAHVGGRGA